MILFKKIERDSADKETLAVVERFIQEKAFQSHKSAPPPLPTVVVYAQDEESGVVLGTMGLDMPKNRALTLATHWDVPLDGDIERFVQIGRWFVDKEKAPKHLAAAILYPAALVSVMYEKNEWICELKEKVFDRFAYYGCEPCRVDQGTIKLENIPAEGLPYYQDGQTIICTMSIDVVLLAVKKYIVSDGAIQLD